MILFSFELRFETDWTRRKKKKKGGGRLMMATQKTSVYLALDSNTRTRVGDGVTLWFFHVVLLTHGSNQPRDSCAGKWPVRTFVTLLNRAVLQLINVHLTSVLFPLEIRWGFFVFFFLSRCVRTYIFDIYGRILKRLKFSFDQPDSNRPSM